MNKQQESDKGIIEELDSKEAVDSDNSESIDSIVLNEEEPKKKIPLHYWILGGLLCIPLIVPIIRLTEALILFLLRVFI